MIIQVLIIFAVVLGVGVVIAVFKQDWLTYYFICIMFVVAVPIALAWKILQVFAALARLFWSLFTTLVRSVLKSAVFVSISVPSLFLMFSILPELIGRVVNKVNSRVDEVLKSSTLNSEIRRTRRMLVEIVTEEDDQDPEYSDEDRYREEMQNAKDHGKHVLAAGDTFLSITIGGLLLVSQFYQLQLFQGLAAAGLVSTGLFAIAVSVLYRVSLLDYFAFSTDASFSSLEEMDVALSFQKAVSSLVSFQYMLFVIVLALRISRVDMEVVEKILRFYYRSENSYIDTMKYAWELLLEQNSDD